MCGEQWRLTYLRICTFGSSPRVRGTVTARYHGSGFLRFIPACAGNSALIVHRCNFKAVHPRVCGEQKQPRPRQPENPGSSPRVRGTDLGFPGCLYIHRFIPACAGNRHGYRRGYRGCPVHPRVCGEQSPDGISTSGTPGSSPRVRGTETLHGQSPARQRFIPACAGNSPAPAPSVPLCAVHPRVCGEQRQPFICRWGSAGSSPRVRGTVHDGRVDEQQQRFIPACAGNRLVNAGARGWQSVHPRVCGEQLPSPTTVRPSTGSSPRVRGTVQPVGAGSGRLRFIPACAGNRPALTMWRRLAPVHPRVCGEQRRSTARATGPCGSSPRVRGTDLHSGGDPLDDRFIPACAGNSTGHRPSCL